MNKLVTDDPQNNKRDHEYVDEGHEMQGRQVKWE